MFRRALPCVILATAGMFASTAVHAQDVRLKPALTAEEEELPAEGEQGQQFVTLPRPTSLEVNPLPEPAPLPKKRKREDDPYAALGIDLGAFLAYPTIKAGGVYTDNVAQSHSHRKGDIGLRLRPALRVESDWVRHEFALNANGDFAYYLDQSDYDSKEASATARLRLDVRRTTDAIFEVNYYLSQDSAGTSDVPGDAIGDRTDHTYEISAGLAHRMGRFETRLKTGITWETFDNVKLAGGGEEDNSDRNFYQPEVEVRAGYEVSPVFKPYIEAAYRPRFHDVVPDRNGFDRDSNGYALSAGIVFEPSPIWSGDLAIIYLLRDYDDPALATLDTFGLTGNVVWRPSEITRLTFTADTWLDETSLDGSSGSRNYSANLDVLHELRDNIALTGGAGVEIDDFQGVDLDELTLKARLGIIYRLSRFVALTGDYDFTWFDSTTKSSDYTENRVTAGVEVRR
jgi:hypothetical protein